MSASFNVSTAVYAAGFAFEVYNEPSERDARWERGADGCDVAFLSDKFARECYAGRLEVRLIEAKELAPPQELAQALLSGDNRDPYVIFALNEESDEGPREGAIGLGRAVDRARSSTVWSKSLADQWKDQGKRGAATWPEDERFYLYVKDPKRAQLALTVFDEEVLAEDIALGATSVSLSDLLRPDGSAADREWSGWLPLTWRPSETRDNAVMMGTVAGAAMGGPMGAVAGGFIGSMIKKPVQGQVRIELKYTPLREPDRRSQGRKDKEEREAPGTIKPLPLRESTAVATDAGVGEEAAGIARKIAKDEGAEEGVGQEEAEAEEEARPLVLANCEAPKGGTQGLDWSALSRRIGAATDEDVAAAYELCCFVTHRELSTEAALWRDRSRRLLVMSFRGTSDVVDVLTDIKFLQTPFEQGVSGQESDDERKVHAGFFASARAVNRRLKELLVAACAANPGEWQLLVTGHSLGGALATLMAVEVADAVDTSRGFKEREDTSWWAQARSLLNGAQAVLPGNEPARLSKVSLYTFGAPRVGNSAFARHFESVFDGKEAFRIVNDRDIVPRLPRGSNAAGAVLDYEHVGRTVLVTERSAEAEGFDGFWVEGESDDATCPLRGVSPLSNPFSSGQLLGDVSEQAKSFASEAWGKIDAAAKVRSRSQLQQAVNEAGEAFSKASDSITARVSSMNPLEVVSLFGLDKQFVQSELQLAESIGQGTALEHHLEPSYYLAMTKALDAALDGEGWAEACSSEDA